MPEKMLPSPKRQPIPLMMATTPGEYVPDQQEMPVVLTSVQEMVQWAKNWARSKSV